MVESTFEQFSDFYHCFNIVNSMPLVQAWLCTFERIMQEGVKTYCDVGEVNTNKTQFSPLP